MPDPSKPELLTLLHNLGVRTIEDRTNDGLVGFPVTVSLPEGHSVTLDLTTPGLLTAFDPSQFGVAVLDEHGLIRKTWGLANRLTIFRTSQSMLDSSLGPLLDACLQGSHGALYLDGYRYFSAGYSGSSEMEAVVLVVNAHEEQASRRQASKSSRVANALRRVGKVFTMNQQVQSITVAAAHEIASATELAAVLLWTVDPLENCLKLAASVGANRAGTNVLSKLALEGGSSCIAELVATTRAAFMAQDVGEHLMTCELEAKFCYLRPGGVSVHPLVISDRLLGVLELIGREEDPHFEEDQALFQTIAEHFALALNAAIMFEDFEKLATHDALTGIANHRYLQEFLHQRVLEAARTGQELGVIMLDVDHFRSFNEEEGHDAGDDVLRLVADAIKICVRPYDLAARYGGEEFTVVMPGSSEQTTLAVAERIRQRVESISYMTRSGRERHITASLGVATYPNGGIDAKDLLKAADIALFEAKRAGRNRLVSFTGQLAFSGRKDDLNLAAILVWIPDDEREASDSLYSACLHDIATISNELELTVMQTAILQALIRFIPTYRRIAKHQPDVLERLKSAEEFRLLLPSLEALDIRYADRGNKIPILARVAQAILAVVEDQGKPYADDPDRFDPEIIGLVLNRRRAA